MMIYAKATVFAAKEVPDNLTKEQIEELESNLQTDITLDLGSMQEGGSSDYSYQISVDGTTPEKMRELDSYLFDELTKPDEDIKMNNDMTAQEMFIEELEDRLPQGSGINDRWDIEYEDGNYVCKNSYDHMNDVGMYDCVIPFTLSIPENNIMEFQIDYSKEDQAFVEEDMLDEYLNDTFADALREISKSLDQRVLDEGVLLGPIEPSMNRKLDDFARDGKPEWFARSIVEGMTTNGFTIEVVQKRMAALQKAVKGAVQIENDKTSITMKLGTFIKEGNPEMIASALVDRMSSSGCTSADMQKRMADLQQSVSNIMFRDPDMHNRLKLNEKMTNLKVKVM